MYQHLSFVSRSRRAIKPIHRYVVHSESSENTRSAWTNACARPFPSRLDARAWKPRHFSHGEVKSNAVTAVEKQTVRLRCSRSCYFWYRRIYQTIPPPLRSQRTRYRKLCSTEFDPLVNQSSHWSWDFEQSQIRLLYIANLTKLPSIGQIIVAACNFTKLGWSQILPH